MAVSNIQNVVQYTGNSSSVTAYPIPFPFLDEAWIKVQLVDAAGTITDLTLGADYAVTGAGNPAGGDLTTTIAYDNTYSLAIYRVVPLTQLLDLLYNDRLPAAQLEQSLDKLTYIVQQLNTLADAGQRALTFPVIEPSTNDTVLPAPSARIDSIIYFNATGEMTVQSFVDIFATEVAAIAADVAAAAASAGAASSSASAASSSQTAAGISAAAALASQTAAGASETAAGASETAAGASETAAGVSAAAALASETAAGLSETAAGISAAAALASETAAGASEAGVAADAGAAAASAAAALASEGAAGASETASAASAAAALASENAAAASALEAAAGLIDNATTNTKLADMAEATVKGRITAGTGDPEDIAFTDFLAGLVSIGAAKQPVQVTGSITADNGQVYYGTASATYTDPTGVEGKGFVVFVRAGTQTVGGTAYAIAGTIIHRIYSGAAWVNYSTFPVIDEDSFATDSPDRAPSQQSVKAYNTASRKVDLISSGFAASVSSIEITDISTDYGMLELVLTHIRPNTDSVSLWLRTSSDNGASYDSGASDYSWVAAGDTSAAAFRSGSAADTKIILTGSSKLLSNVSTERICGVVRFLNHKVSNRTEVISDFGYIDAVGAELVRLTSSGLNLNSTILDAIQILPSSGTFTGITYALYGYKD